jgi:predicted phosphodiesterase
VKTWAIINDLQIPWQDKSVLDLVLTFIEELKPHGVVMNGDVVDCYELSEFDKNPMVDYGLDREIDESRAVMGRLAKVTTERWWIGGNHEDRLRRALWKNPKFARIHALQFEQLFRLSESGFQWKPYGGILKLGKLIVTHGSSVNKHSGWTTRTHFEKYGNSVLVGHTHRLGLYYKTNAKGIHAAYENGCLCKLNPEYVQYPDWQQGFSVVHVEDGGFFSVQQIPILNGRCFFYGNERYTIPKGARRERAKAPSVPAAAPEPIFPKCGHERTPENSKWHKDSRRKAGGYMRCGPCERERVR